jgi:hypothetical protein
MDLESAKADFACFQRRIHSLLVHRSWNARPNGCYRGSGGYESAPERMWRLSSLISTQML